MALTCQQAVIHHARENLTSKDQLRTDPFDLLRGNEGRNKVVKGVLKGGEIPPLNKMYKRIDVTEVGRLVRPLPPDEIPTPRVVTIMPQENAEVNRSMYSSIPNIETHRQVTD